MNREHLNDFEQLVLLSVLRLGDGAYGAAIRKDLNETAGRSASVASIYVALSRMEQRGLANSRLSDPTPVRGGKAKKLYALQPAGIRALQASRASLNRMWADVSDVLDAAEG